MSSLLLLVFIFGVILIGISDILSYIIPNKIIFPLFILGIIYQIAFGDIKTMLIGFIVGFTLGFIAWILGGMGGGDVKLMATIGIWLGIESFIIITLIASFLGIIWSIVDFISQKKLLYKIKDILMKLKMFRFIGLKALNVKNQDLKKPIPFGSCLALATIIIIMF